MRWTILLALLSGTLLAVGCSTDQPLERFQFAQVIMGVRVDIAAYAENREKATEAARAAFAAMNELDRILSDYRPDSEAMVLCSKPAGVPVPVSDDLHEVLRRAREISEATDGAFDVTVGPLVQLWRESRRENRLPDPEALRAAREKVGWRKVVLGTDGADLKTVTLLADGMRLDFGGIGKGYAADRALSVMQERGVPRTLVAVAGDIAAGDPPPDRKGWTVALERGGPDGSSETEKMVIGNEGVSTSGDTEQFVEIGGVRYSHIVDPRTGTGLTRSPVVTVVAPDTAACDALATAICVLGVERGTQVAKKFNVRMFVQSAIRPPTPRVELFE